MQFKLTTKSAYEKAAESLIVAHRMAKQGKPSEDITNVALGWMELAVRIGGDEDDKDDKKIGFHHDD